MAKIDARVLIAEDNKVNQQVANTMLNLLGCSASTVENGKQVIEKLKSETFDLVLMDGQMPELDGYEATRQIRQGQAGERNRAIPIVAITANVSREGLQKCFDVGMDDFLAKPIEFEVFSGKIRKWLGQGYLGIIEKKAVDNLKEIAVNGNVNLVKDLVQLFKQEVATDLYKLRQQAENSDFVSAARTAHHMKSSCANLGVHRMRVIIEKIEIQKNEIDREQLLVMVKSLEAEYHVAIVELQKIMST
ncbi:MAG: response regulator [Bdellovibrionaceae bacterium]|nr:response regulator [Pseudobdellovibrionaceae bacterium]